MISTPTQISRSVPDDVDLKPARDGDYKLSINLESREQRQQRIHERLAQLKQMLLIPQIQELLIREELSEKERSEVLLRLREASLPTLVAKVRQTSLEVSITDLALASSLIDVAEHRRLNRQLMELDERHTARGECPTWNRITGELRYRGEVVRRIRGGEVAKNIILILDQFEASGWRDRHVDLSGVAPFDDDIKLRDAVKSLNTGLNKSLLRFEADGTGRGVLVRYLDGKMRSKQQK